jgi:hypothetical protein
MGSFESQSLQYLKRMLVFCEGNIQKATNWRWKLGLISTSMQLRARIAKLEQGESK